MSLHAGTLGETPTWYKVLLACRKHPASVTALAIAQDLGLRSNDASAWIAKLWKWGYLARAGRTPRGRGTVNVWRVTKFGREYKPGPQFGKRAARIRER